MPVPSTGRGEGGSFAGAATPPSISVALSDAVALPQNRRKAIDSVFYAVPRFSVEFIATMDVFGACFLLCFLVA